MLSACLQVVRGFGKTLVKLSGVIHSFVTSSFLAEYNQRVYPLLRIFLPSQSNGLSPVENNSGSLLSRSFYPPSTGPMTTTTSYYIQEKEVVCS
jgi:hypothetical protein